ncbi:calcium-binding protein [Solirubrobacter soli]|uniref:calcium-binding protein n=1 Tax=Solirubrobacter soli TaxID=363832 RepID=UPI00040B2BC6|nr:hypothetical protein [Solirubrobacter soli]
MRSTHAAIALLTLGLVPVATASAGVVQSVSGQPAFQAASGEVNAVLLTRLPGGAWGWFDYLSPLTAGPGCSGIGPVTCMYTGGDAHLGNGDDKAYVDSATLSYGIVYGDAGDDDFHAGGSTDGAGYGGPGNDTITLASGGGVLGDGGSGDDRIYGYEATQGKLDGGPDDDVLISTNAVSTINGDGGNDTILYGGLATTISGGAGDDTVKFLRGTSSRATITTGAGDDVIRDYRQVSKIDSGTDNDQIDVSGGGDPDEVTCGTGFDTVWADPDDVVAASCEERFAGPSPQLPRIDAANAAAERLVGHQVDLTAGLADVLGSDEIGPGVSTLDPGLPEAYRAIASTAATVDHVSLRVAAGTTASRLVIGVYADNNGHPGQLLTTGELAAPTPDAWNEVSVAPTALAAGLPYWIAVMGTGGALRIANHDGGTGNSPSETGRFAAGQDPGQLPATWRTLTRYPRDGLLSAFAR